jgi:hypothetical protein
LLLFLGLVRWEGIIQGVGCGRKEVRRVGLGGGWAEREREIEKGARDKTPFRGTSPVTYSLQPDPPS